MATDLTPNGTTGTLVEQCFVDPTQLFTYADMNVLANNSAYLCQRYETMLSAYHYLRTSNDGATPPRYHHSNYIQSYVMMSDGSYNIAVSTQRNNTGRVSGSSYTGTMLIDGTVLCTFGTAGTTAIVPWTASGGPRWILVEARIISGTVDQVLANDYWVGYRRVVTT